MRESEMSRDSSFSRFSSRCPSFQMKSTFGVATMAACSARSSSGSANCTVGHHQLQKLAGTDQQQHTPQVSSFKLSSQPAVLATLAVQQAAAPSVERSSGPAPANPQPHALCEPHLAWQWCPCSHRRPRAALRRTLPTGLPTVAVLAWKSGCAGRLASACPPTRMRCLLCSPVLLWLQSLVSDQASHATRLAEDVRQEWLRKES